jgi:bifunctional enzyme CysN/CysC
MKVQPDNLYWHRGALERWDRAVIKGQKPCVIWLTGLSASGKSTIANELEQRLHLMGRHTMLLDGDNVRNGLNRDLGFTEAARVENIRRIGEVAKLMADAGLIVITAFISPYLAERDLVRRLLPPGDFVEVYVSTPLEVCERRDPKGIYEKARRGEIPDFTGISAPYEVPQYPELTLDTTHRTVEESSGDIVDFMISHGVL